MEFIDKVNGGANGNAITDEIIKKIFPKPKTNHGTDPKKLWEKLKKHNRNLYRDMQEILLREQNNRCCYCMKLLSDDDITIEHVIPKSTDDQAIFDEYMNCMPNFKGYVELSKQFLNIPHHSTPPYPLIYAYYNLTASCKGVTFISGAKQKSQSCNNFRNDKFITPMMFYSDIKQQFEYYEDGEAKWPNEPNEEPSIVVLGLNDNMLKMIRRMWFGIQEHPNRPTKSDLASYTDSKRQEMISYLIGVLFKNDSSYTSDLDILNTFKNETYWNIFLKYDYFQNVKPRQKNNP